ncbi:MAG: hypothetical protein GKR87_08320 [Kiritimatiellae bacterium]|nr:hypothetical protein [Kiritimatiellia bacterium]
MAKTVIFDGVLKGSTDKSVWLKIFEEEKQKIINLIPEEHLLLFDAKEGWEPLCNFLETDIPEVPFPHSNKKQKRVNRTMIRYVIQDLFILTVAVFVIWGIVALIGYPFPL